jgi:hypothetical protein
MSRSSKSDDLDWIENAKVSRIALAFPLSNERELSLCRIENAKLRGNQSFANFSLDRKCSYENDFHQKIILKTAI